MSANDVSRSSPIDYRRYVFSRLRVEKERSGVAVVTGKEASTCSRMDGGVYRDALHAMQLTVYMRPVRPRAFFSVQFYTKVQF